MANYGKVIETGSEKSVTPLRKENYAERRQET